MKKQNSFIKAGAVLIISGVVVKLLGAVYRIPLTRILGARAMGQYSMIFSLFMPFYSLANGGIVPTIAHFTAGNTDKTPQIYRKATKLYVGISAAVSLCFIVFAKLYSVGIDDNLVFIGCVIIAPTIIFAAVENIIKGITQGRMDMLPTAKANILESICKAAIGLCAVLYVCTFHSHNGDLPVKVGLGAVTLSGFVCALYLLFTAKPDSSNGENPDISAKSLIKMSSPIAFSALTVSITAFFDTAVCLPLLDKIPYNAIVQSFPGASFKNAGDMSVYLYGVYQGMVLTMFNLVPAVISSVSAAGLPAISRYKGQERQLSGASHKLFNVTAFLSIPTAVYMFYFRSDLLQLVFALTPATANVAEVLLGILLFGSVLTCFNSAFNSVLYAMGKSDAVFRILVVASVVKCVVNVILCTKENINIRAFPVSACVFYAIIFVLSISVMHKNGVKFKILSAILPPAAATVCAMLTTIIITDTALCYLPILLKIGFSSVIYGLIYLLVNIITGFVVDISD